MTSLAIRVALGAALALSSALTVGQPEPFAQRDRLIQIIATHEGDEASLDLKVSTFLATMTASEALNVQSQALQLARKNGMPRLDFAKAMLALNERYVAPTDPAIEYWRYVIMIASKLERGEIQREEYDYLMQKKFAETQRWLERPMAPPAVPSMPVDAQTSPTGADGIGAALIGVGRALQRPNATATRCFKSLTGAVTCSPR